MIKAVIFDLDNTLMDFMKMKVSAIDAAIEGMIEAGFIYNSSDIKSRIFDIYENQGYENQEVFDKLIKEKLGHIDYKILAAGIVSYRKAKEASLILYPGVKKTLINLIKQNIKLAVVTDAPSREAWIRLCSVNLHHMFDAVVTFNDTGKHKPSKEPFLEVLEQLDVKAKNCLMVGDWPDKDVVGAKSVGMLTAFAKYGNSNESDCKEADYILNDFNQIISIVS